MSWVDLLLLAMLAVSVLIGLWRGFVYEVLALLGWFVAYLASPWLAPLLVRWMPAEKMGPSLVHGAGLLLAFVLVLLIWGLGARLVRALIQATPLSFLDRLLGGGFGVLRGLLLGLLLVLVVDMTPAARWAAWQGSQLAPQLQALLQDIRPVMPDELNKLIPA